MVQPPVSIEEYRRQEAIRVEATNWALEGIPEEQVRYHTCWGSWHTPHTTDIPFEHIIDLMLRSTPAPTRSKPPTCATSSTGSVWEDYKLPDGKLFIPGVVAHKTTTIEPPELVADRIVRYANMMGRENIIAGVDCGVGGRSYPEIGWAQAPGPQGRRRARHHDALGIAPPRARTLWQPGRRIGCRAKSSPS